MPYELWERQTYEIISYAVVDGDTIYAEVSQERPPRQRHCIRLHGIDAPEKPQPYGPDAAQYLDNLIARSNRLFAYITCESDPYGRAIAILHRGVISDSLNARLVRAGLAYAVFGNNYRDAERAAHAARAGVWRQRNGGERPWDYRRGHPRRRTPGGCFGTLAQALLLASILLAIAIAAAVG